MDSETFGIIANGPSATVEDAAKLRAICGQVIAVNDAWRLCKDADHLYATDMAWWDWAYPDVMRDFDGQLWTQRVQWTKEPGELGIGCYESEDGKDVCTEYGKIHTGSNSGYAAINVAFHLGAKLIYLLGYDMSMDGDRRHSVTGRPERLNVDSRYPDFIKAFHTIRPDHHGLEIVNLSRRSALVHFPFGDLDELYLEATEERAAA